MPIMHVQIAKLLQVEQDALVDDVAHTRLLAYDKFVGVELHPVADADSIAMLDPNRMPMLLGHVPEGAISHQHLVNVVDSSSA